ncbi:MAG TPA: SCP2 sterol-binding domain-containing protein [Lachnospiraceae bacterium]|nr:SCP2 sterol-binding domain-containing protein [Lachnospiraceae bacterium]
MKVNVYYGGRGLIEDPTIYVMNKLIEVLKEIRVEVTRYNLYEEKNGIAMLPATLKEADGVILAANIEWWGVGGLMQQFLDACWLYGDKKLISQLYMMPVVLSSTYGEREAMTFLVKAWEILGGVPVDGLCAYVADHADFETNPVYRDIIEKKAESLYRSISQKRKTLPTSTNAIKQTILRSSSIELTPQESEQLSVYVSDDTYVKKQKEDIEELASLFKEMLGSGNSAEEFVGDLKEHFEPMEGFKASFEITISDKDKALVVEIDGSNLKCYYGRKENADVIARTKYDVMKNIVSGRGSLQKAFMTGDLSAKGNFKLLKNFDVVFPFE